MENEVKRLYKGIPSGNGVVIRRRNGAVILHREECEIGGIIDGDNPLNVACIGANILGDTVYVAWKEVGQEKLQIKKYIGHPIF